MQGSFCSLTNSLVATLDMSLTIPLAMVADMVIHGRHWSSPDSSFPHNKECFTNEHGYRLSTMNLLRVLSPRAGMLTCSRPSPPLCCGQSGAAEDDEDGWRLATADHGTLLHLSSPCTSCRTTQSQARSRCSRVHP